MHKYHHSSTLVRMALSEEKKRSGRQAAAKHRDDNPCFVAKQNTGFLPFTIRHI